MYVCIGLRAAVETKCALSGVSRSCTHRIKLGDRESYYHISPSSRARITAVCDFFTYIRYIQQGLVRHDAEQMFWEVTRLRREMTGQAGLLPHRHRPGIEDRQEETSPLALGHVH
ncbi:guanine nucleotide exchange factor for Rab-3A-like [Oncorhynchus keta]|uniref:guanine nucleotide exchange factor for Rab-3A-like n=1 Tax=Oncorhynchus keta TaxID=8018 RepID=UPI00227A8AFB|nr:guanine nucleotide exchange factor for Rab-3A-like [Oncorhynchus keta]